MEKIQYFILLTHKLIQEGRFHFTIRSLISVHPFHLCLRDILANITCLVKKH